MSRIKHLRMPALVLAITMMVAAIPSVAAEDSDELYRDAVNHIVTRSITTEAVVKGTFTVNSSCKAQLDCDNVSYVFCNLGSSGVKFGEYWVSNGARVKRGDIIAEVTVAVPDVEIEQLEMEITTAEENLDRYIDVNNALLRDYEKRIANAATASDRKTAQLLYDRLSVSFEEEKTARTKEIENLRNTYESYFEKSGKEYITASADGVVSGLNRYRNGDSLGNYSYMCAIYDTDSLHVTVQGGSELLSFNMPVSITQGTGADMISVEGRVTSNKNVTLAANLIGSNDYVEITGEASLLSINADTMLRFQSVIMKNALMVPKKAVGEDTGGYFVYRYENGLSIKQYILAGGSNIEYYWVVDGLNEGDLVVIK